MKNIKNMKVGVLVGQLSYVGGVGITAVNEVRELRKLGVDAQLIVIFRKKNFDSLKDFSAQDIPVVFLSDSLPRGLRINFKFPGFSFFSFFHLSSIFWAPFVIDKYDAIIVHETYNSFCAIVCAKLFKFKLLTYLWDPVSYIVPKVYKKKIPLLFLPAVVFISKMVDCFIIKNSDRIILGSELHEKFIKEIIPSRKIIKIPTGTKVLTKANFNRKPLIIALTKWDRGKNPEFLLDISSNLKLNFKFIIAGNWTDFEQEKEFKAEIKKRKLDKKVFVIGKVTEEEKFKLFSQARVLVHPIIEAFGMMALEAAGCGCPFIIPKNSGVTELFIDKEHGFFVKEGDLNDFVEKISLILGDKNISALLGKKAYNYAAKYSWESHSKSILRLINLSLQQ